MTFHTSYTQKAPPGIVYTQAAFDKNLGKQIPFKAPGDPDQMATVTAVKVAADGRSAELFLEMPNTPTALATGKLTRSDIEGSHLDEDGYTKYSEMTADQFAQAEINRRDAAAALQALIDAVREHRREEPVCDGFFCIGKDALESMHARTQEQVFMLLHTAVNRIIDMERDAQ